MAESIACNACGKLQSVPELKAGWIARCCRCGSRLSRGRADTSGRALALTLAALILYPPANLYPILRMQWYGAYAENTVWQGSVRLFEDGEWLVATVVFLASIAVPLLKLLGLLFLVVSSRFGSERGCHARLQLYRFIAVIGPWAMLDVYLLAILVALVKLGQFATVMPGPGLVAFTAMVVLTILATESFDPRSIWGRAR